MASSIRCPASSASSLFAGASPLLIQRRLGLTPAGDPRVARRALQLSLLAWAPIAALASVDFHLLGLEEARTFAADIAVHARLLVAVPLLVVAEGVGIPRLGAIAAHFRERGYVAEPDRTRFDAALATVIRLRDSPAARLLIVVSAYAVVAAVFLALPAGDLPRWHMAQRNGWTYLSLAGWWHALVGLPVLLVLLFGWLWRLLRWTLFLWLVSRLDLKLLPAHPDLRAGLGFVGHSVRACMPFAAALGVILAGTIANEVIRHGAPLSEFVFVIITLVVFAATICIGPLFVFVPRLLEAWHRGVFEYGSLADAVGRQFEKSWIERGEEIDRTALDAQAFSATTDLFSVVANVYEMRIVPLETKGVLLFVVATLLPFVPVVLAAAPLDVTLERLAAILL